jgi:hypothetical protein
MLPERLARTSSVALFAARTVDRAGAAVEPQVITT